jgi:hypothetical protein
MEMNETTDPAPRPFATMILRLDGYQVVVPYSMVVNPESIVLDTSEGTVFLGLFCNQIEVHQ